MRVYFNEILYSYKLKDLRCRRNTVSFISVPQYYTDYKITRGFFNITLGNLPFNI